MCSSRPTTPVGRSRGILRAGLWGNSGKSLIALSCGIPRTTAGVCRNNPLPPSAFWFVTGTFPVTRLLWSWISAYQHFTVGNLLPVTHSKG
jgi:hypothetical protein